MNKAHTNINWENYPSYNTPLNQQNLNKMDISIDLIDDRVITLDTTKLDKSDAQTLVRSISLDRETGIFTITYFNGSFEIIDTLLEKIAVNFGYDSTTQRLSITLDDGTVEYIDLSALITQYEFLDSETIAFQVQADGKIKAVIKKGSITEEYLRPDYLADIKIEAEKAKASEQSANQSKEKAENSAKLSESYARGGTGIREGEEADNAKEYARQAKESADAASSIITETFVLQSEKGIPGGIPTLDESGKIPYEQIPDMEGVVLGVKGNLESEYRTGYINLTAEDIGALAVDGDSEENTVTFISYDSVNPSEWTDVFAISSGDTHKSLFSRISTMFKNVRYLYKMIGSTDISTIGNGTITGAIDSLNTDKVSYVSDRGLKIIGAVGINQSSYTIAPFLSETNINTYPWARAGYGFHNAGSNAAYLYLDIDGRLRVINNEGVDRVIKYEQ